MGWPDHAKHATYHPKCAWQCMAIDGITSWLGEFSFVSCLAHFAKNQTVPIVSTNRCCQLVCAIFFHSVLVKSSDILINYDRIRSQFGEERQTGSGLMYNDIRLFTLSQPDLTTTIVWMI